MILFWWDFLPRIFGLILKIKYRLRLFGRQNIPTSGPLIYIANHQSFLDLPAIGSLIIDRPFTPIARSGLFDSPLLARFMLGYRTIAVDQENTGPSTIKDALNELKAGRCVLVFPEGERTMDGALNEFARGAFVIIKRAKVPVVPIAVEGVFDAWPRNGKAQRRGWIAVKAGKPLSPEESVEGGSDASLERLKRKIETMRLELRAKIRKQSGGQSPKPGPADHAYWEKEPPTLKLAASTRSDSECTPRATG